MYRKVLLILLVGIMLSACGGKDEFPSETLRAGAVFLSRVDLQRVEGTDATVLSNCDGVEPALLTHPFAREVTRQITVKGDDDSPPLTKNLQTLVVNAVAEGLDVREGEALAKQLEVEYRVPPGSRAVYDVEWIETLNEGVVEVIGDNHVYFYRFSVPMKLDARLADPRLETCEN